MIVSPLPWWQALRMTAIWLHVCCHISALTSMSILELSFLLHSYFLNLGGSSREILPHLASSGDASNLYDLSIWDAGWRFADLDKRFEYTNSFMTWFQKLWEFLSHKHLDIFITGSAIEKPIRLVSCTTQALRLLVLFDWEPTYCILDTRFWLVKMEEPSEIVPGTIPKKNGPSRGRQILKKFTTKCVY